MSEKAKLTREQAEAIEHLRNQGSSNRVIMRIHLENNGPEPKGHHQKSLQEVDTELLMQALVNDYEVEQTPEDKVRDYYDHLKRIISIPNEGKTKHEAIGEVYAITKTLNLLNIKIDGVNA